MILPRKEFHNRWGCFRTFETLEEKLMPLSIDLLMKEIRADAPFRNHRYLFNGRDFSKVQCDDEVGVNKYCGKKVKTEAERIAVVDKQIMDGTYKPVDVFMDKDHPTVICIDDGFHRVYCAWKRGKLSVRCNVKIGKFILKRSMPMEDLPKLLGMLDDMFKGKYNDIKTLKNFLETEADKKKIKETSIGY